MIPSPADRRPIRKAAAHLGVAEGTFRRWLRDGIKAGGERIRPECAVIGGRIYTTIEWLDNFNAALLAAKTKTPARVNEERAHRANAALAATGW
jgi:hypothetical protein